MSEAEPTGTHAIPPPPNTPREARESDAPVHRKGVSWRIVGAALGMFCAAMLPTSAILMEAGGLRQQITEARGEIRDVRAEVTGLVEREQDTREAVAVLKTRVDRVEQDVAELKRRPTVGPPTR